MPVEVLTPAEDRLLCTVAEVRAELRLTTDEQDEVLADLVLGVSDTVEAYTERVWARQQYSETLPGQGTLELLLARRPVWTVDQVLLDSMPITDYTMGDRDLGVLYRRAGWWWTGQHTWGIEPQPDPSRMEPRFSVQYWAGYRLPNHQDYDQVPEEQLPARIRRAAVISVVDWFRKVGKSRGDVEQKNVGDFQLKYRTGEKDTTRDRAAMALPMRAEVLLPRPSPWS